MPEPRAVLFDLDDTLYDHTACARAGLVALKDRYEALGPIDELEHVHHETLEAAHLRLLAGEITQHEARTIRTQQMFAHFGTVLDEAEAWTVYGQYRAAYDAAETLVPGSLDVLDGLRAQADLRFGIVTNNLVAEQVKKLANLGLTARFDEVVISEAVGTSKPDPRIFHVALERLGVHARETVMVGDSLRSDIEGAEAAGIRSVWLDRRGEARADETRAVLSSWTPAEVAVAAILGR